MSQQERRRTPYPWTWEPTAAVTGVLSLTVLAGLQMGRTVANGLTTGHWQIAPADGWASTAPAVVLGDAAAGLDPRPPAVASAIALWTVVALVELLILAPTALALRWVWRGWNPWRPQGFARPAQVEQVLGLRRLRRTAHLIRPDLHHHSRRSR